MVIRRGDLSSDGSLALDLEVENLMKYDLLFQIHDYINDRVLTTMYDS